MFINAEAKLSYLQSAEWQNLKKQRLTIAQHKCEYCDSTHNLHLHHVTYERLTQELLSDVVILCKSCHQRQHDHYGYNRTTNYLNLV